VQDESKADRGVGCWPIIRVRLGEQVRDETRGDGRDGRELTNNDILTAVRRERLLASPGGDH